MSAQGTTVVQVTVRERDIWPPSIGPAHEITFKTAQGFFTITANIGGVLSVQPEIIVLP